MDESSKQHTRDARESLPLESGKPVRYDTEYRRNGVSNLFIYLLPQKLLFCNFQGFQI